jgi:hypothetical protein
MTSQAEAYRSLLSRVLEQCGRIAEHERELDAELAQLTADSAEWHEATASKAALQDTRRDAEYLLLQIEAENLTGNDLFINMYQRALLARENMISRGDMPEMLARAEEQLALQRAKWMGMLH